jgi:NitT/TauT family transport system substrate-binding protein
MLWSPQRWPLILGAVYLIVACAPSAAPPTPAAPDAPGGSTAPVSAAAPASAPAPLDPPATVRMGVLGITAEAGAYVAADRGYFAEEGIVPEFVAFDVGARAIPALATSQVDASGGSFSPSFINAVQRGVNIKMVAGLSTNLPERAAGGLLVRTALVDGGTVREWADLRGLRFAIPARGTVGDYAAARALALGGLTLADVDLVELPFPDMMPALANANIDVAHSAEPLTTLAVERGVAVKWRHSGEYLPHSSSALLTYGPRLLEEQPEVGQRWLVAMLRGARDYLAAFEHGDRRAEVVDILVRHTSVKDASLHERMTPGYLVPDGAINLADLAGQVAVWSEEGLLQTSVDVAAMEDRRFREAAVARLGPHQR